jgi:hypothetical protein
MQKALTYSSFIVATLMVFAVFVTATSYIQLAIAIALYPVLAYIAFKIFPRKTLTTPEITIQIPAKEAQGAEVEKAEVQKERVDVSDIDKRAFLKLIGAAGLSFFLFSFLRRRTDNLFGGQIASTGVTALENASGNRIDPAEHQPTDGYTISEIDEGEITYYGFINKDGAWFIMREDIDTNSYRYAKGDSAFPENWVNRERLKYDYFHNVY